VRCAGTAGRHMAPSPRRRPCASTQDACTPCVDSADRAPGRALGARPVGTRAAPSGELGVENVEGVGRDLRNVDVVQRPQIAGDDPAVLLERVGWPPALLQGDQLCSEVSEGPTRMRSVLLSEFDLPGVRLVPRVPLPCRLDGLGRPPPRARQGVTPYVDPELPSPRRELSNARHRPRTIRHAGEEVARPVAHRRTTKAPAGLPGPLTWFLFWHPQRDSNPCRHLERAQTVPHRGRWSP
jgi:hypothetical protein